MSYPARPALSDTPSTLAASCDGKRPLGTIDADGLVSLDHVVIGPTVVYVIGPRPRSKRQGRDNSVVVEADGRVLVNGDEPDRCPIKQVAALRSAMKSMLGR